MAGRPGVQPYVVSEAERGEPGTSSASASGAAAGATLTGAPPSASAGAAGQGLVPADTADTGAGVRSILDGVAPLYWEFGDTVHTALGAQRYGSSTAGADSWGEPVYRCPANGPLARLARAPEAASGASGASGANPWANYTPPRAESANPA